MTVGNIARKECNASTQLIQFVAINSEYNLDAGDLHLGEHTGQMDAPGDIA